MQEKQTIVLLTITAGVAPMAPGTSIVLFKKAGDHVGPPHPFDSLDRVPSTLSAMMVDLYYPGLQGKFNNTDPPPHPGFIPLDPGPSGVDGSESFKIGKGDPGPENTRVSFYYYSDRTDQYNSPLPPHRRLFGRTD